MFFVERENPGIANNSLPSLNWCLYTQHRGRGRGGPDNTQQHDTVQPCQMEDGGEDAMKMHFSFDKKGHSWRGKKRRRILSSLSYVYTGVAVCVCAWMCVCVCRFVSVHLCYIFKSPFSNLQLSHPVRTPWGFWKRVPSLKAHCHKRLCESWKTPSSTFYHPLAQGEHFIHSFFLY